MFSGLFVSDFEIEVLQNEIYAICNNGRTPEMHKLHKTILRVLYWRKFVVFAKYPAWTKYLFVGFNSPGHGEELKVGLVWDTRFFGVGADVAHPATVDLSELCVLKHQWKWLGGKEYGKLLFTLDDPRLDWHYNLSS